MNPPKTSRRHPPGWFGPCLTALMACLLLATAAQAEPPLAVRILPQGQVERLTQVVASFSRPMRPLGDMEQDPASAPLVIEPRPSGSFRWLDPRTLAYILDQPLTGAARLRCRVPAGARALDGSSLTQAVEAVVETPAVRVLEFSPRPGENLGPRPELSVVLNQAVDPASLAGHAYLLVGGRRLALKAREAPQEQWRAQDNQLARVYALALEQDLPVGQTARLVLEPGLRPAQGGLASVEEFWAEYRTFGPLALVKWDQGRRPDGSLNPAASLLLEFNNPVSPKEVWRALRLAPAGGNDEGPRDGEPTRWVYLDLGLKPRQAYQLILAAGLADEYGTRLTRPIEIKLATGDLAPIFSLMGGKGVLEAGVKGLYPLRLRNVGQVRAAARLLSPEEVVPACVAEQDRPWNRAPSRPTPAQGARLTTLEMDPPLNQTVSRPLDLAKLLGRPPLGGLTLLDLRADLPDDKGRPKEQVRRALVQVTDLGLSLKLGATSGLAWVTRLATGQPLEGVDLELRDRRNRVLWRGESDASGLAELPSLERLAPFEDKERPWLGPQVYLLAKSGEDMAVLPSAWSDDLVYSLAAGIPYQGPERRVPLLAHAIAQLPLYQPGQVVRLLVFLRAQGPRGLEPPPAGQEAEILVRDPYGREINRLKGRPDAYGSLAGELALSPQARLGEYSLSVKTGGQEAQAGNFRVASFRPPDFKVEMEAPGQAVGGQGLKVDLEASYLFGAPVAQGEAQLRVEQRPEAHAPPRLEGYAVGDPPCPTSPRACARPWPA